MFSINLLNPFTSSQLFIEWGFGELYMYCHVTWKQGNCHNFNVLCRSIFTFIRIERAYAHILAYAYSYCGACVEVRGQHEKLAFSFSMCVQRSNSVCQAWWLAYLNTKPCHLPVALSNCSSLLLRVLENSDFYISVRTLNFKSVPIALLLQVTRYPNGCHTHIGRAFGANGTLSTRNIRCTKKAKQNPKQLGTEVTENQSCEACESRVESSICSENLCKWAWCSELQSNSDIHKGWEINIKLWFLVNILQMRWCSHGEHCIYWTFLFVYILCNSWRNLG